MWTELDSVLPLLPGLSGDQHSWIFLARWARGLFLQSCLRWRSWLVFRAWQMRITEGEGLSPIEDSRFTMSIWGHSPCEWEGEQNGL